MLLTLFRRLFLFVIGFIVVAQLKAQPGMGDKIIAWKKSLTVSNTYKQYANVLNFPVGNVSQELWTSQVLAGLTDNNELVRKRIAYIIGEKKLYPSVSVPALIRLLNDPSDSVANNAIFSLTAFGPRIIQPLFELIERNPPPYVSDFLGDISYDEALKQMKAGDRDTFDLRYFYSRSAMRAMLTLRFMGDTVAHFLPRYPKVKDYYKLYLLDGMPITASNFDPYYKILKEQIDRIAKEHTDMLEQMDIIDTAEYEYIGSIRKNYVLEKLTNSFSLNDATALLREKDTSLVRLYKEYVQKGRVEDKNRVAGQNLWMVSKKHPDSLPGRLAFYYRLNELCIKKDSFYLVKDSIVSLLQQDLKDWGRADLMLMVLLANMGDSARFLAPEVLQHALNGRGKDIKYLAIKALINFHLRSDSTYIVLPNSIMTSYIPDLDMANVWDYKENEKEFFYHQYFILSDELREGMALGWESEHKIPMLQYDNPAYGYGKVYLDKTLSPVTKNLRWLDVKDTVAVRIITEYTRHEDRKVRLYAIYTLGLCDSVTEAIKNVLISMTNNNDDDVRKAACQSLLRIGTNDKQVNAFATAFTLEDYFQTKIQETLKHLIYEIDIAPLTYAKGGGPAIMLPDFPNPPPRPSVSGLAALKTTPAANATVGDIYETLRDNLKRNEYTDLSSFRFTDGFALQTRMERIKSDGTIDYSNRYIRTKIKPKTMGDYFYQLFCGEKGAFRGITFIVCSKPSLAPFGKELINADNYDFLFAKGSSGWLTNDISTKPFAGNNIHILVYEYGKSAEGVIQFTGQSNARSIGAHFNSLNLSSFKLR